MNVTVASLGFGTRTGTAGFVTLGFGTGGAAPIPVATEVIRNFSLREWRQWKRDDEADTKRPAISEAAAQVIEAVALRQSQEFEQSRLDDAQRVEELHRELQARGIEYERVYFEALAAERERLIDAELQQRLRLEMDNRDAVVALLLMAL